MKTKITLLLLTLFMFVGNIYSQFDTNHPDLRLFGYNCTSNNVTIQNVYLSASVNGVPLEDIVPTCNTGVDTYNVDIWMNYTQNQANSIDTARLFATLTINGVSTDINKYLGTLPSTKNLPPGKIKLTTQTVSWVCGQTLSFNNILVVWAGNGIVDGTTSYTSNTYNKAQCEFGASTYFAAPLAVQFTYKACKVGNNNTVSFTSTTNGGTAPYHYSWDFGDGSPLSTLTNPTHIYTSSGKTAKLTVTDSKLPTAVFNSYSLLINTPNELILTESHQNSDCNGAATGSINLGVSGGSPSYTYSWTKNGTQFATSEDLSTLSAGTYIVTVTDSNGCIKNLTIIISGVDTTKPVVPVLANVIGQCTATAAVPVTTDNCSGTITGTTSDALTYTTQGTHTITWTFTDAVGNFSTATQNVVITDTTKPVVPVLANVIGQCTATATVPVTTDNCSGTITGTTSDALTYSTQGTHTITWTFTDAVGNFSTATQNVVITDTTKPVVPVLANVIGQCTATATAPVTTDNCSGTITGTTSDALTYSTQGTHTITWTFTDAVGNFSTATQNVIVDDVTPPSITTTGTNLTINCPATPVFTVPTATDNCSTATINVLSDVTSPGNCAGSYSRTITWDATDESDNHSTTVSQTITVQDITAPTFTPPANITINSGENCIANTNPTITGNVTNINDTCDSNPKTTYIDTECFGITENNGSINAGNGNYFPFTISGFDDLSASNIEKIALSFETNQGKGRAEFTLVSPSGQGVILVGPYCTGGNCDDTTSSSQELYLPVFYPNSSGYTQWDNNNLVQVGIIQNFTPNGGTTSPNTITGLTSYVPSFENLTGPMNGTWFIYSRKQANVNGSIDFNSICLTPASSCTSNKVITRTWTVTDACGNFSKAIQTIKIQDKTAPILSEAPADVTAECSAVPAAATLTATDNCDAVPVVTFKEVRTDGNCASNYTLTRTWTATDVCGNTASKAQVITVQDKTAPVLSEAPADVTAECS
ncbi:PKD domain-containing protein, partial [Flavobacterium sp. ZT3R17]|uniref:HYR-like domain-containing protein n=1 Tax=Flavobacterium cryoconiti TaxID=3398736 RepID=UPI003A8B0398